MEAVAAIKAMHYELDRLIHNANTIPYDFDSAVVTVLIVCYIASIHSLDSHLEGELRIILFIRFGKQAICAFPGSVT